VRYRKFGLTKLDVSEVGFGGAGVGHVWGQTTDSDCLAAIRSAVDLGINFFDTSPMYGGGKSEENLGIGLEGLRDRIILASKVRLHSEDELDDLKSAIERSVASSLKRLKTDRIDVLQIHHQVGLQRGKYLAVAAPPRYAMLLTEDDCLAFAEAAQPLINDGRVGYLGITAWDGNGAVVKRLCESGAFASAQILYNLVNHSAAEAPPDSFDDINQGEALISAKQNNVAVIGVRSHAAGALVDKLDREVAPDSDVERDHKRSKMLEFLKSEQLPSLSAVALRYCLDNQLITTVTPGFKNETEVAEAVRVADAPKLTDSETSKISMLYHRQFSD